MAIRRVRVILAVVAVWLFASWYYTWRPDDPFPVSDHGYDYGRRPAYTGGHGIVTKWEKLPTRYPVKKLASLPTGKPKADIPRLQASPSVPEDAAAREVRLRRLAAVKTSFVHSWEGYKKAAWLHDEIKPISGASKDPFGGWAATLVDSLDSLWIMGLTEDFERAVEACDEIDFSTTEADLINVFETTIRYLGGFLAAYELSERRYPRLLTKAVEVADLLMCAFDTPNRAPVSRWDWRSYTEGDPQKAPRSTLVAEIGSLSLEFSKLSQLTGDMQYHDAAQRISDEFEAGQRNTRLPGMWPVHANPSTFPMEFPGETFTLGGMSDSLYEYFPKQYLLLAGRTLQPRKMYEGFVDVAKKHLLRRALNPEDRPLMFFGDARVNRAGEVKTVAQAQHLTCFAGGMVGMAARIFNRPADLDVAAQLTDGCVWSYNSTPSGIGPEIFTFVPCDPDPAEDDCRWSEDRWYAAVAQHWRSSFKGGGAAQDDEGNPQPTKSELDEVIATQRLPTGIVRVEDRRYILRPEAIESVFMMHRLTADPRWAEAAWAMFEAVERHTRTPLAAAALDDITRPAPRQVDSMESFWLAETLKYFYLVFADPDVVSLDEWVLNTAAHPLRRADAAAN